MANEILSEKDLEHIKTHGYVTSGYSWLDNRMNPFWIKCAKALPQRLSPNMVTLIGLLVLSMGVIIILPFDSSMKKPLPSWAYILFALFLFGGQTFDAIDGKHARNTNRASPLGQLMDHGCDAFSNSFIIIMIGQAHLLGGSMYLIVIQMVIQFTFFVAQWEEHHTGTLLTQINNFGVTEVQFVGMAIAILPVVFGTEFSSIRLFGGLLSIGEIIVIAIASFTLKTAFERIFLTLKNRDFKKTFYPFYSLICLLTAELLSARLRMYQTHSIYILIINGLYFGFQTSKLIISTMAKKQIEAFSYDNLVYLIAIVLSLMTGCFWVEVILLTLCTSVLFYRYAYYMFSLTIQLLNYLNINF